MISFTNTNYNFSAGFSIKISVRGFPIFTPFFFLWNVLLSPPLMVRVLKTLGKVFIYIFICFIAWIPVFAQNDAEKQRMVYKQKLDSVSADTASVDLLQSLAFSYVFEKPDTAIMYVQQGLSISKNIKYKKGEANCLYLLSMALTILGNYSGALHFGFECLALSEEIGDSSLMLIAYDNLMGCYREQEDYTEALKNGYKGLAYAESPKVDLLLKTLLLGNMSSVFEKNNQLDSALLYGLKSFESGKSWWSGIYLTLGNIYAKSGDTGKSFIYYRTGINIAEQNLIFIDLVDFYHKMSVAYEASGNTDSSFFYAKKSMNAIGTSTYPEGELRAAAQLAHLYELQGAKDSTIKYLKFTSDLRNNLISRQKTREAQSFAFNEQWHQQELLTQMQQNQSKVRMYVLIGFVILAFLTAYFLWRNNRHKQKSNILLQEKNTEIQTTLTTLKSTQAQLVQSEKMASLGELTAGIAHEIQNPLNFVNNFSEVSKELVSELKAELKSGNIKDAIDISDNIDQNLEKINHHGKRADSIVKGMLQHSRTSAGQKEPANINALADEYLRLAYQGMRAKEKTFNTALETDFDETLGQVNIIPQDIGRVMLNLYNNAFYAVSVKAKELYPPYKDQIATADAKAEKKKQPGGNYEPLVTVRTKKIGNKVEIIVKDNGNGIPEKIKEKIFQPFFTTKPTGQGTGLGLSLSYDIVKAHGGTIEVKSGEVDGTTFKISLPA